MLKKIHWRYHAPVILCFILIGFLLLLPTGYEDAVSYKGAIPTKAEVLSVDDSRIISTGLIKSGEQRCQVRLLNGKFKGNENEAFNMLSGSLENDKIYQVGDHVMTAVNYKQEEILSITMIDHYRMDKQLILAALFATVLVIVAGRTGIRAILSFVVTVLMIWKLLVPLYLKGFHPVFTGIGITLFLTACIISLVYGFDRKCLAAVSGSFLGIITTCILGVIFTDAFKIHGAIMAYSESLLYSGYQDLNLTWIFMASIFIGASGAMMDLAVDITSAIDEVIKKKPEIGWVEAAKSGMNVGRAAMGTMTTTLLLAYSGGYVALLMVFMAQGTPIYHIMNYKYVSSEILDTIIGSMGLVTVAPFTAATSALLLCGRKKESRQQE